MQYWLMKSEPSVYSIDDLKRERVTGWEGVRNYQARNFMRDEMKFGDLVLFYHSNTHPPGVAGIARIVKEAYPDDTAEDRQSPYYDKKAMESGRGNVWVRVDVELVGIFARFVALDDMRSEPTLAGLMVTQKGCRLSVQPVDQKHFLYICQLGGSQIKV
jgi:predicted RNA-binding protein with PUA-like domain